MSESVSTSLPSSDVRPDLGDSNVGKANGVKHSLASPTEVGSQAGYRDEFWGGLAEQGEKQAQQLKLALKARGIILAEGTRIPQRVIEEVLSGMDIKANFWQAMITPSLLSFASGGLKVMWDPDDKGNFYSLVKTPQESSK
jgi:hypothetical protein